MQENTPAAETAQSEVAIYVAPELSEKINMAGISVIERDEINKEYSPYLAQVRDVAIQSQKIDFINPGELDIKIARDLRLRLVKVRTSCETQKKERKRIHQLKADIEQLAYNIVADECTAFEKKLKDIEQAEEMRLKAEREALKVVRTAELKEYNFDAGAVKLEDMTADQYELILSALKTKKREAEEAEAKAEIDRLEKEAREKIKNDRIKELMNLGGKQIQDSVLMGSKDVNCQPADVRLDALEIISDEIYSVIFNQFQAIAANNAAYEGRIKSENAKLLKEKEDAAAKQNRHNERISLLCEAGGDARGAFVSIADVTKGNNTSVEIHTLLEMPDNTFVEILKEFKIAKHNNDYQLAEANKERVKQEELKKKAAEAKENRFKNRLTKLAEYGGRPVDGGVKLDSIIDENKWAFIPTELLYSIDDEDFLEDIEAFKSVKLENDRQLDIEVEANKQKAIAESKAKEQEQAAIAKLELDRKAALAPDKEKLLKFAEALRSLPRPELKANEAANIMKNIEDLLGKTITYLTDKSNQL